MAEAVVGVLISKLGEALLSEAAAYGASLFCGEASALKGLFSEIRRATGWLEIMKAYLQDSEKFRDTSNTTDAFVKKIRALAFRIEDVTDEFKYKLEDGKHGGFAAKMNKRIRHVKVWHRLTCELRDINADLEDAAKQANLCAIPIIERPGAGNYYHAGSINPTSCFARDEDLVGIEDNAEKLKGWLLDMEEKKSRIVAIWGMGGAGKTTLVGHVYKSVKEDFDFAAWVTVSKSWQVQDLLNKIATGLGISGDINKMETRSLGEVICNHLNGKRFILVLDDVWEKDVWIKIMNVFPANCTSRFVLTSRHKEVASLAASSDCIMGLELLKERHSWELFCNVAFRNNDDKRCPMELHDLAAKFIKMCEGLPLAITCIGHLLFFKHPTHSEWKKVHDDLVLQLTKHVIPGVDMILKLSLEDLPYELKNCFLHCALFPEDYEMNRKRLIRHWIAAGFIIVQKGNQALEEVAEGYLNELVNRSLLQVVERNEFGRVRRCRMHDIVRHLALDKAENEGFGIIYEDSTTFPVGVTRRLSIESTNFELPSQSSVRHIRAVHAFMSSISVDLLRQILASSNLLSTLDLQGTQIKILPDVVFNLFNLRFLSLRYCEIEVLQEAVGRLVNLEVLDAYSTRLLSLPKGVAKLKKLKFLYVWAFSPDFNVFDCGTEVPRGIRNLTGLHTLQSVKANFETLCGIAALSELRTFAISNVKNEHSVNLCSAIMNMSHLINLSITASNEDEVLQMEALHLPATLSKLSLVGQLEKKQIPQILLSWSHLMSLTRLSLAFTKLDDDSFSSLRALRGLCRLELSKAYDGTTLCFPTKSFPRLRFLGIMGAAQLNHVDIEEGALENLVDLMFIQCPELKHLPHGIEYLAVLRNYAWKTLQRSS
ncbi:hypothetical protein PR202_ga25177 [Eleusine coracana subsp. coracana]|uniref:Uncharacterized protein n=1 Tax=Eleusine coracana subsp. coracana TaxID=191504 RepID=A0AAV5DAA1_ELECO|nr:hypothetical protein PR202_ga25177 [Eleusine coracana subsp. coracana]